MAGWSDREVTGRSCPIGTVPPSAASPFVGVTMNSWQEPTVDVEHVPAVAFAMIGWAFPPEYDVET